MPTHRSARTGVAGLGRVSTSVIDPTPLDLEGEFAGPVVEAADRSDARLIPGKA